MRKKIFSLVMACCIVFSLFAVCVVGSSADNVSPAGNDTSSADREPDMRYTQTCYIIPASVNVAVGQSEYIQTSMGDHQIEHYTFFRWTSSDTSVATVDVYGNVTGVAPGTATINLAFTTPGHMEYDTCEVHVKPATPAIYLSQGLLTMDIGDTAAFPIEWYYPTNSTLVFSSDNDRIASVNSSTGTITAHGCGLITLNVQISGNSSTVKHLTVRVEPSETETQGINSNSVYMIKDTVNGKYLSVNSSGTLSLQTGDEMNGRQLWYVQWRGNGYYLYSMGCKDGDSNGGYETVVSATATGARALSEHDATYEKWSIQKYGNYWYLTPVGLAYRDMALCSYGTASTQLKSLDTATNTESRWVFEEIDTSTFNNYWSGSYIGQGETVHIKVELDTDGDDSVFKNDIISEDDFDVLDEWNDISSNIKIYLPGESVPSGITPFIVTFKGYTPLDVITNEIDLDVAGETIGYKKILFIDIKASLGDDWNTVNIFLNTNLSGILQGDILRVKKTIIHEFGHALKLAHPKGVNFLQDITNGRGSYTNDNCVCAVMNQGSPEDGLTCSTPKWHDKINLWNKWGE